MTIPDAPANLEPFSLNACWTDLPSDPHILPPPNSLALPLETALHLRVPGLLLSVSNTALAWACVSCDNSCLILSQPAFHHALSPVARSVCLSRLLHFAESEASRAGLLMTCMLLSTDNTPELQQTRLNLKTPGFQLVTHLSEFSGILPATSRSSTTNPAIHEQPLAEIPQDHPSNQQLLHLLHEILDNSRDLPQLPTPSPSQLLQNWTRLNARLLVLRNHEHIPAALCCFRSEPIAPDHSHRPTRPTVHISFLGVHPRFRRLGFASQLLRELQDGLYRVPGAHNHSVSPALAVLASPNAVITAHVDESNLPAIQLYQHHGFQRLTTLELWARR